MISCKDMERMMRGVSAYFCITRHALSVQEILSQRCNEDLEGLVDLNLIPFNQALYGR